MRDRSYPSDDPAAEDVTSAGRTTTPRGPTCWIGARLQAPSGGTPSAPDWRGTAVPGHSRCASAMTATMAALVGTSSLAKIRRTCVEIVQGLTPSFAAIAEFVSP